MEAKFLKEIEKQMDVKTLKDFEKELRTKISHELEVESKTNPDLARRVYFMRSNHIWRL